MFKKWGNGWAIFFFFWKIEIFANLDLSKLRNKEICFHLISVPLIMAGSEVLMPSHVALFLWRLTAPSAVSCHIMLRERFTLCVICRTPWWTFTAPQLTAIKLAACKCWLLFRWLMAPSGCLRWRHQHFKTECDTVIKVRHENRTLSIFVLSHPGCLQQRQAYESVTKLTSSANNFTELLKH